MKKLNFKAFENWNKGYKSRLNFTKVDIVDFDKSIEEINKLLSTCDKTYDSIEKNESCCLYANGLLIAVEDFCKDNFSWWEHGKIPKTKDGYDDLSLILSLYRQLNANPLFSIKAGNLLDKYGQMLYDNYSNLNRIDQALYWSLMDTSYPIVIDILFKITDTEDESLMDAISPFIDEINKKYTNLHQDMSNITSLGNYFKYKTLPWIYYYSEDYTDNKTSYDSVGKWMYFFKSNIISDVINICQQAIEDSACESCKHTNVEETGLPTGVICFYCDGFNINAHKNILNFMLKNNLIQKTKTGKLYNISFKFDNQTRNHEYGNNFKGFIKLADFLDLMSGKFYNDERIKENLGLK